MSKIVYQNDNGGISIIHPANCGLSIEQIALKDVPAGKPFKIVDDADIPTDRTYRDAWTIDMSNPDGTGADYGVGSDNQVIGWNEDGTPIMQEAQ